MVLFYAVLIPFALAGLALMNAGLGRSRNAAHAMASALCAAGVAIVVYVACGFSLQEYAAAAPVSAQGPMSWAWSGKQALFLRSVRFDGAPNTTGPALAALLGMFSVALAALIPLGSGGERWRLGGICASTAVTAGLVYPLFAHWAWGGGWLARLGEGAGFGRGFVDAGGSASIQALGGLTALSIAWILGPRRGKFATDGMPAAIPGHNVVFTLVGCFLALVGWMGINGAGAILYAGVWQPALVAIDTVLSAAAAALAAALLTRMRYGKPDASLSANGWVSGLVASSASCAFAPPAAALLIGLVAGGLVTLSVEWLELRLHVDDPGGAVSVHAVAGIWGVLAVGLFDHLEGSSGSGQWLAQVAGIATLLGFVLPVAYGANWALDRVFKMRVSPEGERQGLDLHELGANAYPELAGHIEDFTQR